MGNGDVLFQMTGRYRGEEIFILSFSPLFSGLLFVVFSLSEIQMTGRFTGGSKLVTLILPSLNRKLCFFYTFCATPFLTLFYGPQFYEHFLRCVRYIGGGSWSRPHTMYIYSLRAFLTTKGALIDGD